MTCSLPCPVSFMHCNARSSESILRVVIYRKDNGLSISGDDVKVREVFQSLQE